MFECHSLLLDVVIWAVKPAYAPAEYRGWLQSFLRAMPLLQETASHIRGLKLWVTNEYRHSGIRDDGARIFERLLGMARNVVFD